MSQNTQAASLTADTDTDGEAQATDYFARSLGDFAAQPETEPEAKADPADAGEPAEAENAEETDLSQPEESSEQESASADEEQPEADPEAVNAEELVELRDINGKPVKVAHDSIAKRIAQEVGKRKGLEDQLTAAKAELDQYRAGNTRPVADLDPVAMDPEVSQTRQAEEQAQAVNQRSETLLKRLNNDPEAVVEELKAEKLTLQDWSEEGVREFLEGVRDRSRDAFLKQSVKREMLTVEKSRQIAAEKTQFDAIATQTYAWMGDEASQEQQMAKGILSQFPFLNKLPGGKLALGHLVAGEMKRMAKAGPKPAGKPALKPAPHLPAAPKAAPAIAGNTAHSVRKRALETGDTQDVEKYFQSIL